MARKKRKIKHYALSFSPKHHALNHVVLRSLAPQSGPGLQISGAEVQELQNEWEDCACPPVGTAKFVLGMSVIQFIVKVGHLSLV